MGSSCEGGYSEGNADSTGGHTIDVWCPNQVTYIDMIEKVQKKATRAMFYRLPWSNQMPRPPYHVRCQLFGLETLEHSRKNAQCIFMHKLLNGLIDAPEILNLISFSAPTRDLRSRSLIRIPFRSSSCGANDPLIKMCVSYNRLESSADFHIPVSHLRQL